MEMHAGLFSLSQCFLANRLCVGHAVRCEEQVRIDRRGSTDERAGMVAHRMEQGGRI